MKKYSVNGDTYLLAGDLTDFQLRLYIHLCDWKRRNLTKENGHYRHKGRLIPYDVLLPQTMQDDLQPLYRPIVERVRDHQRRYPFRLHQFVGHMASSQIACMNLFVPLLQYPDLAADILRAVNPDLKSIATDELDHGFRIEFWPGSGQERGLLNDHSAKAGTDSDIAIAYRDHSGRLKLWLIEHKLTEKDFTTCGGAKSQGRTERHRCKPAADILRDHSLCYYHDSGRCRYAYWTITERHPEIFPPRRMAALAECPFKGGLNQLWRNTLLALAIEDDPGSPYESVRFSVVHHPDNPHLEEALIAFSELTAPNNHFTWFTSRDIIHAASKHDRGELQNWIAWYRDLYRV